MQTPDAPPWEPATTGVKFRAELPMTGSERADRRGPTDLEEPTTMKDRLQLRAYRLAFAVSTVMALATSLGAPRKFG